jgi:predicted RecB family nuclease
VKSSSGPKDYYYDDIAIQAFVLEGAGVTVSSIELIHVNTAYVRGPGGICWPEFFARMDVCDPVAERLVDLPSLPAMRDCLDMVEIPEIEPGGQCHTPYVCEFWDRCTADKPADWINYLPRLSQARASDLKALGIEAISLIPADFPLSSKQVIIRDAIATGKPYVGSDLAPWLRSCRPPTCYLDFEAMMPPIPLYEGTRPYQTIPFQWSLHVIDSGGLLHHSEFLAEGDDDPRRQFAETLIEALAASNAPILVYSAYEQTRLKQLACELPDLSESLNALIVRLVDLLRIVRGAVYFPEFQFSNSIKSVAPALCPGFGYDDLKGVADGGAASAEFLRLASGNLTMPEEVANLRAGLLAYCERDTQAMVEVHEALTRLAIS